MAAPRRLLPGFSFLLADRGGLVLLAVLAASAVLVPVLNLAVSPASALHVPTYMVSLLGKYLTFALLAGPPSWPINTSWSSPHASTASRGSSRAAFSNLGRSSGSRPALSE